jgi:hypothetical protein
MPGLTPFPLGNGPLIRTARHSVRIAHFVEDFPALEFNPAICGIVSVPQRSARQAKAVTMQSNRNGTKRRDTARQSRNQSGARVVPTRSRHVRGRPFGVWDLGWQSGALRLETSRAPQKSSRPARILTDSSTRFFRDSARKKRLRNRLVANVFSLLRPTCWS